MPGDLTGSWLAHLWCFPALGDVLSHRLQDVRLAEHEPPLFRLRSLPEAVVGTVAKTHCWQGPNRATGTGADDSSPPTT
ncbi:hypothetical protein GCM10010500_66980 [Streptomyces nigrescens]|nr:hypothetical protein GCM10010500_66980 [Streptomyces libani subsp. libani]